MKGITLLLLTGLIAGTGVAVHAQGRAGNYNPATETTIVGTVDSVNTLPSPGRGGGGLHLGLEAATGRIEVHVGPASFVSSKNVAFAKGDAVTVIGSKAAVEGQDVVIAREIRKGDQVLTLRDAKGFPLWSGRGGRTP